MLCPCHDHTVSLNLQHQRLSKSINGLQISLWMRDEGLYWCLEVPLQSCATGGATQLSDGLEMQKCHMEKGQVQAALRAFTSQV